MGLAGRNENSNTPDGILIKKYNRKLYSVLTKVGVSRSRDTLHETLTTGENDVCGFVTKESTAFVP